MWGQYSKKPGLRCRSRADMTTKARAFGPKSHVCPSRCAATTTRAIRLPRREAWNPPDASRDILALGPASRSTTSRASSPSSRPMTTAWTVKPAGSLPPGSHSLSVMLRGECVGRRQPKQSRDSERCKRRRRDNCEQVDGTGNPLELSGGVAHPDVADGGNGRSSPPRPRPIASAIPCLAPWRLATATSALIGVRRGVCSREPGCPVAAQMCLARSIRATAIPTTIQTAARRTAARSRARMTRSRGTRT